MSAPLTVRFEFTIDEAVDLHIEHLRRSREGASWRRQELRRTGIGFAFGICTALAFFFARDGIPTDPMVLVTIVGVSAIGCALAAFAFSRFSDGQVRRRLRRYLVEQYGGNGPYPCSIEVGSEGLLVELRNVEFRFPWREARDIVDGDEGIAIWFTGGCALARSRGFASPEERSAFLRRVRELLPEGVASESPAIV